jgi:putative ABC transport system substrate-binding protein
MLLAVGATAQAQQPTSIPRIGFLITASPSTMSTWVEAFRQGLRELGYVEGKNILTEHRYAEGKLDRLPALADELVRFQVHIIVTAGSSSTRAAKRATATIPIVMAFDDDPVGSGFAASLARPGANITGSSTLSPEIRAKQLELLKEIVPKLSRVGVLGDVTRPGIPQALREINLAADALRVHIQFLEVRDPKDIETAFRAVSKEQADAVLVLPSPITFSHRRRVIAFAEQGRLPAMFSFPEFVEDGGLMSYGANIADLYRRAATYVDKILKGAKPADLPIEQPTKFELIINLRAAKQIGLTVPPTVLARADRVIQ